MNNNKNLFFHFSEWWKHHKTVPFSTNKCQQWLPTPGNIIFSLLLISLLILTQRVWATPDPNTDAPGPSATTINYQGNLTDSSGSPKNGNLDMPLGIS